jgi:hypothetical protein
MFLPFPKKKRLRPQNGPRSSEPEKLLKIVNHVETKKLKEAMVGVQVEYVGGHQYPPRSLSLLGLSMIVILNSCSNNSHLVTLAFVTGLFIRNLIAEWSVCTKTLYHVI